MAQHECYATARGSHIVLRERSTVDPTQFRQEGKYCVHQQHVIAVCDANLYCIATRTLSVSALLNCIIRGQQHIEANIISKHVL